MGVRNNMSGEIKPRCPRCGSTDTRADEKHSLLKCKRCGYPGHWRQFYNGQVARKEVKKLFRAGKLEGDPLLGSGREEKLSDTIK